MVASALSSKDVGEAESEAEVNKCLNRCKLVFKIKIKLEQCVPNPR